MVKKRELFIILFFVGVLGAALYWWVYRQPAMRRIEGLETLIEERTQQLDRDRNAAQTRRNIYSDLSVRHNELREEWLVEAAALPVRFDDVQVLRHIQEVIYPHTQRIELEFGVSEEREGDELWSTTIELSFRTSYWQFLSILYNLVQGELGNRVVTYEFEVFPLSPGEFREMVEPVLIHMPDYIVEQFRSDFIEFFVRGNQSVEFMGLYLLDITMTVEYLSIEPGLLPLDTLREVWEIQDANQSLIEGDTNV
jgi:hypothetical protein